MTNPPSPVLSRHESISASSEKSPFGTATIRTLRLKPITTVLATTPCAEAIETMRDKGFDQLPVLSSASPSKKRLVGLVTLGNLLSWISQGRADPSSPVEDVMFSFAKLSEVVTDPRDIGRIIPPPALTGKNSKHTDGEAVTNGETKTGPGGDQKRTFVEITLDTPLNALNRFLEWNSAAVVTEREGAEGTMKPLAVVTKVDLLSWLVKQGKTNGR